MLYWTDLLIQGVLEEDENLLPDLSVLVLEGRLAHLLQQDLRIHNVRHQPDKKKKQKMDYLAGREKNL